MRPANRGADPPPPPPDADRARRRPHGGARSVSIADHRLAVDARVHLDHPIQDIPELRVREPRMRQKTAGEWARRRAVRGGSTRYCVRRARFLATPARTMVAPAGAGREARRSAGRRTLDVARWLQSGRARGRQPGPAARFPERMRSAVGRNSWRPHPMPRARPGCGHRRCPEESARTASRKRPPTFFVATDRNVSPSNR